MNNVRLISLLSFVLFATAAAAAPPPRPTVPTPVEGVMVARPFVLDAPTAHTWRAERPAFRGGYLLVLKVKPETVYPRQTAEPVLYVGRQTAQRVNVGYTDGYVVAIVPAPLDLKGQPQLDLETTRIWFGAPALPERIDLQAVDAAVADATAFGITARPRAEVRSATARGGAPLRLADADALVRAAAGYIRTWAPAERDLADGLLAPPPAAAPVKNLP